MTPPPRLPPSTLPPLIEWPAGLRTLADRLYDLSKANPAIRLLRLPQRRFLDLSQSQELGDLQTLGRRLLHHRTRVRVAGLRSEEGEEDPVLLRIKEIGRLDAALRDESGANDLYIGFPFIEGTLSDGTYIRAPLLFFPAVLGRSLEAPPGWYLDPKRAEEEPLFNRSLLLVLRRIDSVTVPEDLREELPRPQEGESFGQWVRALIEAAHLPIDAAIGASLDEGSVLPLPELNKEHVPVDPLPLRLLPSAVLGLWAQGPAALLADYEVMGQGIPLGDVAEQLLRVGVEETPDQPLVQPPALLPEGPSRGELGGYHERQLALVYPVDQSQLDVVLAVKARKDLVLHGPPGTGKSQVIVNLVADAIADGRTVLVVSQKRAALDVVYDRLAAIGLGTLASLVHDPEHDRPSLYRMLRSAIARPSSDPVPSLQEEQDDLSMRIDEVCVTLTRLHEALQIPLRCGRNAQQLYALPRDVGLPSLPLEEVADVLRAEEVDALLRKLRSLLDLRHRFAPQTYPLGSRTDWSDFDLADLQELEDVLERLRIVAGQARAHRQELERLMGTAVSDGMAAVSALESLEESLEGEDGRRYAPMLVAALLAGARDPTAIGTSLRHLEEVAQELGGVADGPQIDLSPAELDTLGSLLDRDERGARSTLVRLLSPRWRRGREQLLERCRTLQLSSDPSGIQRLSHGVTAARLFADYRAIRFVLLPLAPPPDRPAEVPIDLRNLRTALRASMAARELAGAGMPVPTIEKAQDIHSAPWKTFVGFVSRLRQLQEVRLRVRGHAQLLNSFIQPETLRTLTRAAEEGELDAIREALRRLPNDFEFLCEHDRLIAALPTTVRAIVESPPEVDPSRGRVEAWLPAAVTQSITIRWLTAAERAMPILREVSAGRFDAMRSELRRLEEQKRALGPQLVAAKVHARVAQRREQLRGQRGKDGFAELDDRLALQRRVWPIRRVVSTFADRGLFSLCPCWLASPEATAEIFPLTKGLFDLVIFDEASQCPLEQALPAVVRGKTIVVAGDEQQLPPLDLFQRTSFEEDEEVDAGGEGVGKPRSLLRAAKLALPPLRLGWHYRSRYEELIRFSNEAYYGGLIRTLPPPASTTGHPPIGFHQVVGDYSAGANPSEAAAVARLLAAAMAAAPLQATFGIIAFGVPHQRAVEEAIDKLCLQDQSFAAFWGAARARPIDERPFIKNIETVQGDERDHVIFSIGYGPGADGRLRLQLGSLSKAGGEHRLNVAISRAKVRMDVLCSFDPQEQDATATSGDGPKHLMAFLRYAQAVALSDPAGVETALASIRATQRVDVGESTQLYESLLEEQIATALGRAGLQVDSQVGCSGYRIDLAVRDPTDPTRYALGIECDGAMWHSGRTARERDLFRQRVLEGRGWRIHRIWSRNWWLRPQDEVAAVLALVRGRAEEGTTAVEAVVP